jgi:hypothetical protein
MYGFEPTARPNTPVICRSDVHRPTRIVYLWIQQPKRFLLWQRYNTMFGKKSMFSTTKPRKFNYVPVYWDPEKEEKEKREKWRRSGGGEEVSIHFRDAYNRHQSRRTNNTRVIIFVLLALILLIFFW